MHFGRCHPAPSPPAAANGARLHIPFRRPSTNYQLLANPCHAWAVAALALHLAISFHGIAPTPPQNPPTGSQVTSRVGQVKARIRWLGPMFLRTVCQLSNKEVCGSKLKNSPFQFAEGCGRQDSSGNDADIFWYFAPTHFILF